MTHKSYYPKATNNSLLLLKIEMGSESSVFYSSTSVGASVGASVGGSVGGSVGASVGGSVGASVGASVGGSAASSESGSDGSTSCGSTSGSLRSSSSSSAWNEILTKKQELSDLDWYTRIEKKLEKCGLITDATDKNDRKKLIYSLGMKGLFKETYLSLNKNYNENILQKINEDIKLMNDLPESLKHDMTDDEKSLYIDQLLKYRREAKNLDVRMFLSKLSFMNPRKLFFFPEFGTVHAGLEIDGVTIEWGRESLVFPSINTKSMLIHTYQFRKNIPRNNLGKHKRVYSASSGLHY
jgi:DNA-binding MarR family transcriptional regulator